jgi:CspA family cold shock protein
MELTDTNRERGRIKWFDPGRGYGFIERENGQDLFVHYSAIRAKGFRTLDDWEAVEFVVAEDAKGRLEAQNVTRV